MSETSPFDAVEELRARTAWGRHLPAPLRSFLRTETSGALVLVVAAATALAWVNSPWEASYDRLWSTELAIGLGDWELTHDLHAWVNDGLMAIFFFVIGLEVRREFDMGELRDRRRIAVPGLAALGGMLLPVAIFLAFTRGTEAAAGWGVVMPTDTALALGVLALVGRRAPPRLRTFVLTVVIADDVGVLLVIAFAYTSDLSFVPLGIAAAIFLVILGLLRLNVLNRPLLILLSIAVWAATAESGVHPTIAGVVMGLAVSGRRPHREEIERATAITRLFREQPTPELARAARRSFLGAVSRNERLQEALHPWSSFVVVPLFALANAGVAIDAELVSRSATSPVALGVLVGLVAGKLAGIGLGSLAGAHPRLGGLPLTVELPAVFGAAAVCGVGFTLSLFIAEIAFEGETLEEAKAGILAAALAAAVLGFAVFRLLARIPREALERAGLTPAEPLADLAVPVDPERDHVRGPVEAVVTLLEYGDYECPYCGRAERTIRELLGEFEGELRYVWRQLPLNDVHPHAQLAAEAAEAAGAQGAFWPMHDLLLRNQRALEPHDLSRRALELGLDVNRFWDELRRRTHAPRIAADVEGADASGVSGTPSFFVDGRRHDGAYDLETLSRVVREHLAEG